MQDNKIKSSSLIITAIALIIIIGLVIWSQHTTSRFVPSRPITDTLTSPYGTGSLSTGLDASNTSGQAASPQAASVCYALNDKTGTGSLTIITPDGQNATGQLSVALAGKDASQGTLTGTLTSSADNTGAVFDGQFVNMQEGTTNSQEQIIELDADQAKIGYGEMAQNADGTYSYKDKSVIDYSVSMPRVACTQ